MGTPGYSWVCGGCGRRVPLRVEVCHCGASRQAAARVPAEAAPVRGAEASGWRSLPRDVQSLLLAAGLSFVLGVVWLVYAPPQPPAPALLGYVDVPPPHPATTVRQPPFRMPWWR